MRALDKNSNHKALRAIVAAAIATCVLTTPAGAQDRDPVYAAARSAGQVGEKTDGYLGLLSGDAVLRKKIEDLNIRRKAVYADRAQAQHSTIEEYAFTAGCKLIANTEPGEKYQAPDGSWKTRGASEPLRDPRCP